MCFVYVYTSVFAGAFASPVSVPLPPLFAFGFAAEALKDCSKSAMMSSMCSVPTDMRMRSFESFVSQFERVVRL